MAQVPLNKGHHEAHQWDRQLWGAPQSKPSRVIQNCGTISSPALALALVSAPAFCCVSVGKFPNLGNGD